MNVRKTTQRPLLFRLRDERGTSLIELVVATFVLALAAVGLVGSLALGMRTVGNSRQRSYASSISTKRLEEARDLAFSELGLQIAPTKSSDPNDPDFHLTNDDPPLFDINQDGNYSDAEPIIVGGSIKHIEDPPLDANLTEPTEMKIYNYVTWVDDPNVDGTQDYKRVTVLVVWKDPLNNAVTSTVATSTFVGEGSITLPSPTPAPTPTPAPPGPTPDPNCPVTEPSHQALEILEVAGAESGFTNSSTLSLRLRADIDHPVDILLSTDCATWSPGTTLIDANPVTVAQNFGSTDGVVTVYAQFTDSLDIVTVLFDSIVLDSTPPTVPGNLRQSSCGFVSNDRIVTLTWDASQDDHLAGYRLYHKVGDEDFQLVATTSSPSASHTSQKSAESVQYMVRAYDRAGSESPNSNVLTYPRNSCQPT